MPTPTIPGNGRLPADLGMAVQVYWDSALNAGSGGWAPITGSGGSPGVVVSVSSTDAPATGTITSVNDAAVDTTILASNASRKGATVSNDSTAILYLALSNVTASATVYSVQVPAGGYYALPMCDGGVYTGIIKGIWASDASGAARVTEWT